MVRQSCNFLFIRNQSVVFFVDLIELKVFPVNLKATIGGGIVNDDSFVVGIILRKDRIQIVLDPKILIVIVTRNNDAER